MRYLKPARKDTTASVEVVAIDVAFACDRVVQAAPTKAHRSDKHGDAPDQHHKARASEDKISGNYREKS